jgi:hypothetical protein
MAYLQPSWPYRERSAAAFATLRVRNIHAVDLPTAPRTGSAYGSWLDSQHMITNGLSVPVAGAITIALIVGLGIFVYPWLLAQRYGAWIVGLMTIVLGALFVGFQGSGSSAYSLAFAAGWAFGPVIAGVIVHRIQRKSG